MKLWMTLLGIPGPFQILFSIREASCLQEAFLSEKKPRLSAGLQSSIGAVSGGRFQ